MLLPMSWLRDCAENFSQVETQAFMDTMTMSGNKVEGLTRPGHELDGVVVGRVLSIEKHPNADKLVITQIDIGTRTLQIVTGATNLTVGATVPVALDGARLAEGKRIKKGKLRGCESEGMLCDIGELGYTRHDYPEAPENGIYIFQSPQTLGADVKPLLALTDEVVEFEIMSNRPDCNAVLGVVREAVASYGGTFTPPAVTVKEAAEGHASEFIAVEIRNPVLCPRYIARVVKHVRIEPSPLWLRHRLTASGVRPINNIVDITNYVMLEYGQPMHAFDIDDIADRKIVVRNAEPGERFITLDGQERILDDSMLVIADPQKAVAIAGVMGGENSMVTGHATAVLFESANFNGTNVRHTSKKLGLRTDASARFEKGLDPNLALAAVNRAMQLIEELGCGDVVPGIVDAYPSPRESRTVAYDPARVNALLGITLNADEMSTILRRVGIETENGSALVPTFRSDITREADIAEEVARFYGYNRIPSNRTQVSETPGGRTPRQQFFERLAAVMMAQGFSEAMTYPFESPRVFDKLLTPPDDALRNAIRIQNPLGEDFSVMRTTTLGGLLESLALNFSRRNESARLFETAYAYLPKSLPIAELPDERFMLTVAAYNKNGMDFYDIKGCMEELLTVLTGERPVFAPFAPPHMHPGRSASVAYGLPGKPDSVCTLGYLGELHPQACENYQIDARVYVAVLDLDALYAYAADRRITYKPLPKFPATARDIALQVKTEITAASVEAAIREKAGSLLAEIRLFDVYQGSQIAEGYKSMAYTLTFRAPDRTLTDEEVTKLMDKVLTHLSGSLGAVLRDK